MSDAISRLKQRAQQRPTVPAREKSIINNAPTELLNDQKTDFSHSVITELQNDVIEQPAQEQQTNLLETVRRTIRVEEEIDNKLESLCTSNKITRETFLEAAFVVCSHNEELLQEILNEAKSRYQQRKKAGEQRKFQTMAKRMGPAGE